jgi:hypothetical protein
MVVFYHYSVIKAKAMVLRPSYPNGILFQQAQTGGGFAGVDQNCMLVFYASYHITGFAGYPGKPLQKIQGYSFSTEQGAHFPLNSGNPIPGLDFISIVVKGGKSRRRFQAAKNCGRNLQAGYNSTGFGQKQTLPFLRFRYQVPGGYIPVPQVFYQGSFYYFFYHPIVHFHPPNHVKGVSKGRSF